MSCANRKGRATKVYKAPVSELMFTLKHVAGLDQLIETGKFEDLSEELIQAVLTEAGRFAEEEIAPLNKLADEQGANLVGGKVKMPDGWTECYHNWINGGWNALTGNPDFGGQGLPVTVLTATMEIWNAASTSFAICPILTIGAADALDIHGSDDLKQKYLAKLTSGEWTATMNLTEPQAGSDLNALRSRAERQSDGTYRLYGQKIFITYGDHEMTDNIIHFVLARLPDAPEGTDGISLFLVPKVMVGDDGSLGERNDVKCIKVEHKLGIHASPTCAMVYGDNEGAVGFLVGEENNGLACMFTMMNNARLAVGVQGLGVSDRALQQALTYSLERKQGRAAGYKGDGMSPIAYHPDIKRNLMTMMAKTSVSRAVCLCCAHAIDMSNSAQGEDAKFWNDRAALLTPFAKALSTDLAVEVTSTGVQVHGGMGYMEETGAAQHFRDARILPIYEGTNGIQAIDLVMRKLPMRNMEHVFGFIGELGEIAENVVGSNDPNLGDLGDRLQSALEDVKEATLYLQAAHTEGRTEDILAGATPYLRLFGLAIGGCLLGRAAMATTRLDDTSTQDEQRILNARFFAENVLSETKGLRHSVINGSNDTLQFDPMQLAS